MSYRVTLSEPVRPSLINLRAAAEGRTVLESELGFKLPTPSGLATGDGALVVFGLGPDEWLLRTPLPKENEWLARLEEALSPCFASATLVSDAYRILHVTGPDTLDVLAQTTGVDLDPGTFPSGQATRAGFARTSAILHRRDDGPSFDIYVDASLVVYAFQWLEAASGREATSKHCQGKHRP